MRTFICMYFYEDDSYKMVLNNLITTGIQRWPKFDEINNYLNIDFENFKIFINECNGKITEDLISIWFKSNIDVKKFMEKMEPYLVMKKLTEE